MSIARARRGNVEIAYETFGPESNDPLLLVMGAAVQMLLWHEDFCGALVERGFKVARFDNRDVGLSGYSREARRPRLALLSSPSGLHDMAADTVMVLDALGWDAAHVVGWSMGGMIGQVTAVHHPARVRTLTSISSSPGSSVRLTRPRIGTLIRAAAATGWRGGGRDGTGESLVRLFRVIGSPRYAADRVDEGWLREMGMQSHDRRKENLLRVTARQWAAVRASGDRRNELAAVRAPTLVLHGEADPLISAEAGRATARAIPGAKLVTYPGMGHDLPRSLWPAIIDEICVLAGHT